MFNREDQHHPRVVTAATQLHGDVLTTEWILAESADALAKSASRRLVRQFIRDLEEDPKVRIVPAGPDLFRRGLQLYGGRLDKEWSLTDCISFTVMKDEGISEALTGDRHFEQAGFKALFV